MPSSSPFSIPPFPGGRPVFGLTGKSGSGKTTLMEALLALFTHRGLTVSTIKHGHHVAQLDVPGKDSDRHRAAGAHETLFSTVNGFALVRPNRSGEDPALESLLARLSPVDLVMVEGFKREPIPRLEVFRPAAGKAALYPDDPTILAVASDTPYGPGWPGTPPPRHLDLNDPATIAAFILDTIGLS